MAESDREFENHHLRTKGGMRMAYVKTEYKVYYESTASGKFESLVHPEGFSTLAEARAFVNKLLEKDTTLGATLVESIVRDEQGNAVMLEDEKHDE